MPPLRKSNAELLISKGIEQKVPDEIIPDESLALAENVDFSKIGIAKKREGFVQNSNLILGAGAMDEVRRLGVRQRREVLCITEDVSLIGDPVGVSTAGDTLFSYSEQAQRWIARGKMPRPNVDILWTSSTSGPGGPGTSARTADFVTGGIGNYVCVAHQVGDGSAFRVVIFDAGGDVSGAVREAPTIILDVVIQELVTLVGWVTAGNNVWLVYTALGPYTAARAFRVDASLAPLSFDSATERQMYGLLTDSAGAAVGGVSSDGTNIFAVFALGAGGYEVRIFDSELTRLAADVNTAVLLVSQEQAIDARLGSIDIVRRDFNTGKLYISRHDKTTAVGSLTNVNVANGASTGSLTNLAICSYNDTDAVIVMGDTYTTQILIQPATLFCIAVRMSTGAGLGFFNHQGLVPYAQPFIVDGRVFFIAMHTSGLVHPNASVTDLSGTQPGEESFMCLQVPLDNMNQHNVPFPAAQWDYGQCVVKNGSDASFSLGTFWVNGHTTYQVGSAVYVLTSGASVAGQSTLDWLSLPRLTRLEFGDAEHRWRHEEFHDLAGFAGGTPFVYDGTRTYEMSTALHCPVPLAWDVVNGGSLPDSTEIFLRAAMLFVDGNGRECWSQPSRIVSVTTATPKLTAEIWVMPVTTTVKPDMGNGFTGRMKLFLFAATQDAPDEYKVACAPVEVNPYDTAPVQMFVTAPIPDGNGQMYTAGFELDNFPAPPCRSMVTHSGRVFGIASDSNEVFYTKPFRADRGPEFALGQSIPLPDKGTALASLNDRLAIFTHRSVLAVQGDGPDVTGTPPDAFSRPVLVSQDYGCVEYCAVGRTPLGIIFRGQQGLYLLTMGFDVTYIGAQVEDITRAWVSTRSIVHDQRSACCRITGFTGEHSQELCYWYDTKRWSMNLLASSDAVDSVALNDNLLVATDAGVASRYLLGSRGAVVHQDFGSSYQQIIETGWLSFQNSGVLKRVWRVYAQVRAVDSKATVLFEVWKDWETRLSSSREFYLTSLDETARVLRVHLKHQKIKSIKVRITVTSDGGGIELMKLGFELGLRPSGPKEVREQTQ